MTAPPCTTCPILAQCVRLETDACPSLVNWRSLEATDPAREIAEQWAEALPGEQAVS